MNDPHSASGTSTKWSPSKIPTLAFAGFILFFLYENPALAQVSLALSSGSGTPGSTVNLNINLTTTGATLPASLQWTIGYLPGDISAISLATGLAASNAGKSVTCNPVSNSINCIVFGLNTQTISNGVVATVALTLSSTTTNTSTAVSLSSGVASDPNGIGITPVTTLGNTVSISQPQLQSITVATSPAGLGVVVDGTTFATSPQSFQWTAGSSHSISVTSPQVSGGNTRNTFASWSDAGAQAHTITAPSSSATYTASFSTAYLLTTTASNGAIAASPTSPDGFYASGTPVQLTASPNSGFQFSSWSGAASGSSNPVSVTMSAPRSVTASFTGSAQSVTINTSPAGLGVVVDGTTYATSPQSFQWTPGSSHTINAGSPQGSGKTRAVFASWSDGGAQSHSITPSSGATYTASFTVHHQLTTSSSGGTVAAAPTSADGFYPSGTAVQLTATPSSGQQFSSWSGDVSGSSNPLSVTMNAPVNAVANFTPTAQGITVNTNPAGLGVIVDGTTYSSSPQSFQWTPGSSHSIGVSSPLGSNGTRYSFANWSDAGAQTHTVTAPSSAATFTASFSASFLLTTSVTPFSAGSILVSPPSVDGFYPSGSVVQVSSSASSGFQFSSWTGDLTASSSTISVTMNAPKSVSASFVAFTGCTYSVNRSSFAALSEGDIGRIDLTTTDGCNWNAASNVPWITFTAGSNGTGTSLVRFLVGSNPSTILRTGVLTIGGQSVTVGQAGSGCLTGITLSSNFPSPTTPIPPAGTPFGLNISAPAGCEWSASSAPAWLNLTSAVTGTGSSASQFNVSANSSGTSRTGSVSIGGIVAQFIQNTSPTQVFNDVALNYIFADHISMLRLYGVTNGCTSTQYCPEDSTTRAQMAAFIIRALMGETFTFPQTPVFSDVPSSHPFFKYIQKLQELGITNGCSATQYCPDDQVTRGQMAAFMIRTRLGISATQSFPYPTGITSFQDVPSSHPFFPYVQKMRQLGITSGCTTSQYCPDAPTTRGQMAVFLIRALFTP